jgi:hypothetical protein
MIMPFLVRYGWLAFAALPLLVVTPAAGQVGASPAERQAAQACAPDIRAHCASVQRGGGRILACLRQNTEKLSPNCAQALGSLPR